MKVQSFKIALGVFLALALLAVGVTTFGVYQARADGGTCRVKIADICLGEFKAGVEEIQDFLGEPEPTFGAVSGPDTYFEYNGENDVRRYSRRQTMKQATTTLCSFIAPAGASSTPAFASANFSFASTSATTVAFYKSLGDPTATTTILSPITAIAANNDGAGFASSTQSLAGSDTLQDYVFTTGNVLNVSLVGGDSGEIDATGGFAGLVPVGICQVIWQEI